MKCGKLMWIKVPTIRTVDTLEQTNRSARVNEENNNEMDREKRTVSAMIHLYCRGNHGSQAQLCDDCEELKQYAECRLERCPFGAEKPICTDCSIHCYNDSMQQRIREVMRYSGPKMILRHPILAVGHVLDKFKSTPSLKSVNGKRSRRK